MKKNGHGESSMKWSPTFCPMTVKRYVELLGGHQTIHEEKDYYILGLMIDEAAIMYEDEQLIVELYRKKYN